MWTQNCLQKEQLWVRIIETALWTPQKNNYGSTLKNPLWVHPEKHLWVHTEKTVIGPGGQIIGPSRKIMGPPEQIMGPSKIIHHGRLWGHVLVTITVDDWSMQPNSRSMPLFSACIHMHMRRPTKLYAQSALLRT